MKLSTRGLELIKKYEGCRLKAYKPVQAEKYWTIGWGHYGADVAEGMTITQEQADCMLIQDLKVYENHVNNICGKIKLNQNQYDALVSFCYNCGSGNLQKLTGNGTKTCAEIVERMSAYCNGADGKQLAGLVRRRAEEKALFLEPVPIKLFSINEEYEALDFLVERGIINDHEYWTKALDCVHNLDYLIIKFANEIKKADNR